jgi:histidine ammonia-lyase
MSQSSIRVGHAPWTVDDVVLIAEGRAHADYRPDVATRRRIRAGVAYVEKLWRDEQKLYGVTTGFGASVDRPVPASLVKELSRQLARFHGCGLGAMFDEEQTLAILATRLISLARGYSGVREVVLERLADMINQRVLPLIPQEGSVGASGDLTPLSYIAAALMGEGRVRYKGSIVSTAKAFKALRWKPLELNPKEGLALMNGTSVMTALACIALTRATYLERLSSRITAISVLALKGNPGHFDRQLFELKNHPGQFQVAAWIRSDLKNPSSSSKDPVAARFQDPYSLRCAPHIIGVLSDALPWMRRQIEIELNSSNDNPLVDGIAERVMHGGHFYGGHVAFVMDGLKNAVANVADLLDRQLALLVDIRTNHGLPANLSGAHANRASINHGFKAVQIGTSAWTAEALKLTMPASVFSRSTECHNQDKVSMGTISARDALRVLELTEQVAAAVLLGGLQGLDARLEKKELDARSLSPDIQTHHRAVRRQVSYLEEDRPLDADLRWTVREIQRRAWPMAGGTRA